MANHHQSHPSPPMQMHPQQMQLHHGPQGQQGIPQGPPPTMAQTRQEFVRQSEAVWLQLGSLSEAMGAQEDAIYAYEQALRINPQAVNAMNAISVVLRGREEFPKAAEFLQAALKLDPNNGEAWGSLGHCYLMMDDLQQAYNAYQSALVNLRNPKEPRLWYGIGILYDRYGSLDHAEEAFSQVMQMQPDFDKAHEIYFRLGIIYKQQSKYSRSLECFKYIVNSPPSPLTEEDIWFQIGHVHEQQKDFDSAKAAYQRVLERDPKHAKVLQQLGWLHHNQSTATSQERAIDYLEKSVDADSADAQSWYLLGRCYMALQKYPKAYEAYQQAVYRDGRNPTFWCSIGVLYYQINQYRDALDAYSRAIRLNPFISEVWYDLGTLYESCNNQINDALDAYQRAAELDPGNPHIKARLQLLRTGQANGGPPPGQAPMPTDVHPHSYQQGVLGPPGPQWAGSGPPPQAGGPPMPNGAPAPAGPTGWGGRISEINPPPQPPNPYAAEREGFRGQGPPLQRPPSRQDQMRPYQDNRGPEQLRRGPSPPPQSHYAAPPPPPPPQQPQQAPPPGSQISNRVRNPNYGGGPPVPIMQQGGPGPGPGPNGPPPPNPHMPYRTNSPRNDGRPPMHDNRMPSPKSAYPQHQQQQQQHQPSYALHPEQGGPNGPEPGMPHPSQQGMATDPALLRDHDHRPPSVGPKRMREWEDERDVKKPSTDEARARMDDVRHRRPSMSPRMEYRRNSSEGRRFDDRRMEDARRAEEQRRIEEIRRAEDPRHPNEGYHPSEAAHHSQSHPVPPHLPPMQQAPMPPHIHDGPGPQQGPGPKEYPPAEERRMDHPPAPHPSANNEPERAARKMEVDEDYDDSGEEDKKAGILPGSTSGPVSASAEMKNGPANGMMGQKVEG